MMTVVLQSLADVEELEKVEVEERVQAIAETTAINVGQVEPFFKID